MPEERGEGQGCPHSRGPSMRTFSGLQACVGGRCHVLTFRPSQPGLCLAPGARVPSLSSTGHTHPLPWLRDAPQGSAKPGRPQSQNPTTAEPRRRVQRAAGVRGRRLLAAGPETQRGGGRAAPWGPEDGATATPARPDSSGRGRPDSAFCLTSPPSRGSQHLGSIHTSSAPLTLTRPLGSPVGAATNGWPVRLTRSVPNSPRSSPRWGRCCRCARVSECVGPPGKAVPGDGDGGLLL